MIAFGLLGFCAGGLFYKRKLFSKRHMLLFALYGGGSVFLLYGLIMDTAAVIMYTHQINAKILLLTYVTGLPFNAAHGLATFVFLLLMSSAIFKKLYRIKDKYGVFVEKNYD